MIQETPYLESGNEGLIVSWNVKSPYTIVVELDSIIVSGLSGYVPSLASFQMLCVVSGVPRSSLNSLISSFLRLTLTLKVYLWVPAGGHIPL